MTERARTHTHTHTHNIHMSFFRIKKTFPLKSIGVWCTSDSKVGGREVGREDLLRSVRRKEVCSSRVSLRGRRAGGLEASGISVLGG